MLQLLRMLKSTCIPPRQMHQKTQYFFHHINFRAGLTRRVYWSHQRSYFEIGYHMVAVEGGLCFGFQIKIIDFWPNRRSERNRVHPIWVRKILNFKQNLDFSKHRFFDEIFDFWPNFRFLTKSSIVDQNFYVWPKFLFLTKIFIFFQKFFFLPKFLFFTKIFIFDQNFYFLPKFLFLTKISIFDQNFYFWPNVLFLEQNFHFWQNFCFWTKFHFLGKN